MHDFEQDDAYYQAQEISNEALKAIVRNAPDLTGYGGGKWAMYSVRCCWWTSNPDDLGNTRNFPRPKLKPEYERHLKDSGGLPCCPHCGSVLMQAPLEEFIGSAKANPNHYGDWGLWTFVQAHSSVATRCYRNWSRYSGPHRSKMHQGLSPKRYG